MSNEPNNECQWTPTCHRVAVDVRWQAWTPVAVCAHHSPERERETRYRRVLRERYGSDPETLRDYRATS